MNENRLTLTLKPTVQETRLLMTRGRDEVLKAVLPPPSQTHRWAASTLAESMSLWYQQRLSVVLYADVWEEQHAQALCDGLGFGVQNVHYEVDVVRPGRRPAGKRLSGMGSFRDLRQLCLRGVQ
jgi:hypothetical protein